MELPLSQTRACGASRSSPLLHFSFISIILINTLFFSGYYILKDPLAYILNSEGMPLKQAYSITTTANILLAISSLFFGFTLHKVSKQKYSLFVGVALSVLSICLLSLNKPFLSMVAISLYVLGGGLYFFNIVMFINKAFDNAQDRIKGNYIYQIFVNIGAADGCLLFLAELNKINMFKSCFISGVISLLLFIILYKHIENEHDGKSNVLKFYGYLTVLFSVILTALYFTYITRCLVLVSFTVAASWVLYRAYSEQNKNLFLFLCLVFLFNIPYWIANTVIFNQFIYFLMRDVSPIHGISPASLIIVDPVTNILFGNIVFLTQRGSGINPYKNLSYSSLLMMLAFIVLAVGLFFDNGKEKISYFYPLVTMALFACSEFLLQTTLNSRIRDLLLGQKKGEFLATGIMRSSRSFATVLGYYLILLTSNNVPSISNEIHANFNLYFTMGLVCIASFLGYCLLRKRYQLS